MDERATLLEIAKGCAYNDKAEADAIQKYTEFIKIIQESVMDSADKEEIIAQIREIISDELNHEDKLREIYKKITGIEPNKD